MKVTAWLDRMQQKHPWLGFPLAVVYKFVDDQGGYLAALITYYGFVSLFPLLLILSTILSIVLVSNPELQERILDSALSQFPVIGDQLENPDTLSGGTGGLVIGVVVALYGGLGVAVAFQNAMNIAWSVPRNMRRDPIFARVRGLLILATVGVAVIGLTVVTQISATLDFGSGLNEVSLVGTVILNAIVFAVAFKISTTRALTLRQVAPGAIAAAVVWQMLQTFGLVYVTSVVQHSSATNGVFAVVLGLLAFIYLAAFAVVMCVEVNVVRIDKLYPRSLLTPFTENVVLTAGDRRAYTDQALAQRNKDFQKITVSFGKRKKERPERED